MQFLGAANTLVAGSSHAGGRQDGLQARTFGVIPVGAQAGLIEWVQDAKPIYSIWQAWHQRRAQRGAPSNPPGRLPKCPHHNGCQAHLFHVADLAQHSTKGCSIQPSRYAAKVPSSTMDAKPIYVMWQIQYSTAQKGAPSNPPGMLPECPHHNGRQAHLLHVTISAQHSSQGCSIHPTRYAANVPPSQWMPIPPISCGKFSTAQHKGGSPSNSPGMLPKYPLCNGCQAHLLHVANSAQHSTKGRSIQSTRYAAKGPSSQGMPSPSVSCDKFSTAQHEGVLHPTHTYMLLKCPHHNGCQAHCLKSSTAQYSTGPKYPCHPSPQVWASILIATRDEPTHMLMPVGLRACAAFLDMLQQQISPWCPDCQPWYAQPFLDFHSQGQGCQFDWPVRFCKPASWTLAALWLLCISKNGCRDRYKVHRTRP